MEDSAVGTSQASAVSTRLIPHCGHGFSGTEVWNYEGGSHYLLLITPSCSPGLSTPPGEETWNNFIPLWFRFFIRPLSEGSFKTNSPLCNSDYWAGEMPEWVKSSPYKHGNLSANPQNHTHLSVTAPVCYHSTSTTGWLPEMRKFTEAYRPSSPVFL